MRNQVNRDYNYILHQKNLLLLNTHKKFIGCSVGKQSCFSEFKYLRFVFLELYQEGFVSNYYYGFSLTSKFNRNTKLFRPSDRSFFKFSLGFPSLLYVKVFSKF